MVTDVISKEENGNFLRENKEMLNKKQVILKTKRLHFRPFVEADFEMLYELYTDPEVTNPIKTTLGVCTETLTQTQATFEVCTGKITKSSIKNMLRHFVEEQKNCGFSKWAAFESATGDFVGRIGLSSTEDPKAADAGYILHKRHWNKGYATESMRGIIKWAFDNTKLETITATTTPEHTASIRVMEKANMMFSQKFVLKKMEFIEYKIEKMLPGFVNRTV